MAVSTAGIATKDDVLRELGYPASNADGWAASDDEEYRRDVQVIYEHSRAMLLEKTITKKEFDETMRKCRDRAFAREFAERRREWERLFVQGEAIALKYGITEDDVNEAILEVREEMRAEKERAGNK